MFTCSLVVLIHDRGTPSICRVFFNFFHRCFRVFTVEVFLLRGWVYLHGFSVLFCLVLLCLGGGCLLACFLRLLWMELSSWFLLSMFVVSISKTINFCMLTLHSATLLKVFIRAVCHTQPHHVDIELFLPSFLRAFISKGCWILSKVFSASIEVIRRFLSLILLLCCKTCMICYVEPSLHPWNETELIMVYDLDVLLNFVCKYLIKDFCTYVHQEKWATVLCLCFGFVCVCVCVYPYPVLVSGLTLAL
jgi:hypothetical protein